MGGPPVAAFAARQTSWTAVQFKGFLLSFLFVNALLRLVGLAVTGWIDTRTLGYAGIVIPFALLGNYLGAFCSRNIDAGRLRRVAMGILIFLAAGMIIRGRPEKTEPEAGGWRDDKTTINRGEIVSTLGASVN